MDWVLIAAVDLPLVELAAALASGELPLDRYLDRLERRFAERERDVLAFMPEDDRFARLRRQAAALIERHPQPETRPPLFGVPFGVKDVFHAEGFPTTAGSRLPPAELRGDEAAAVRRLKRAGGLVLGKTVSTEFAYFAPGPTRNPHNPAHTPGGSSSGSAAAVAAGLCPLALGTQTIGSVNRPAAFCGVVGFKPTYGRIPRDGVIPLAPSLDHVGFFTAAAGDAALAAGCLLDGWHPDSGRRPPVLGLPEGPYLDCASDLARRHLRAACARLEAAGLRLLRVAALADFDAVRSRHQRLLAGEAARVHAAWYRRHRQLYHPKTAALIEEGQAVGDGELARLRRGRLELRRQLEDLMEEHGVDLWLTPAAPGPAPRGLSSTGDPVMNLPFTHAGMPAVTLPAGDDGTGLPLGLQLAGRSGSDEALLAWANGLEEMLA